MKKILITGGAGFIGSHLSKILLDQDYSVTIVDNLSSGSIKNLSNVIKKIELINTDILELEKIKPYIQKTDCVVHLAGLSRVIPSINNPEMCFKNNVFGTEIIARLCSKYKKKLVFSSSREVYGNSTSLPVSECHPLSPENPYGASKILGESIIQAYSRTFELNFVILRLANAYGINDFDRVIPTFIENARNNKDIMIYGGEQVIDFIYIDDVIDAFIRCFDPTINNKVFNIGSGVGTKLPALADLIIEMTSSKSRIVFQEMRRGEVDAYRADISMAKCHLNWEPQTTLYSGLKKIISEYQKNF